MTEIRFVRTRHFYESYQDFFRLVELSGFETIFVDELDISKEGVYIVCPMNGEWRTHIDNQYGKIINAHLILWNLERPASAGGTIGAVPLYGIQNRELLYGRWEDGRRARMNFVNEVWVSDRHLADNTQLRFVILGSDEGLGEPGEEKHFDFCHMSNEIPRRTGVYSKFKLSSIGPNSWGQERNDVLRASRFGLNIHQDTYNFQEPLRFALFAAYGLPIISEDLFDMYPWASEYMMTAILDELPWRLRQAFDEDYGPYREMGLRARERMTGEFRFKTMVEQAVKESVGRWR